VSEALKGREVRAEKTLSAASRPPKKKEVEEKPAVLGRFSSHLKVLLLPLPDLPPEKFPAHYFPLLKSDAVLLSDGYSWHAQRWQVLPLQLPQQHLQRCRRERAPRTSLLVHAFLYPPAQTFFLLPQFPFCSRFSLASLNLQSSALTACARSLCVVFE